MYLVPPLKPLAASVSVIVLALYLSSLTSSHNFIAVRTRIKRTIVSTQLRMQAEIEPRRMVITYESFASFRFNGKLSSSHRLA